MHNNLCIQASSSAQSEFRRRRRGAGVVALAALALITLAGCAGNAYLRASLYMPALSAVAHDPQVKGFYKSQQLRGKKKIQALCAVMRKYLTGFGACLQNNQPFDSATLFSQIHVKIA